MGKVLGLAALAAGGAAVSFAAPPAEALGVPLATPTVALPLATPTLGLPLATPTVALPLPTPTLSLPLATPTVALPLATPTIALPALLPPPPPTAAGPGPAASAPAPPPASAGPAASPAGAPPPAGPPPPGSTPAVLVERPAGSLHGLPAGGSLVLGSGIALPPGPVGVSIAIGLMLLPLLLGIWLLVLVRTVSAAALLRSASLRLNVAADLGIRPRELAAMTAESLVRVRDEVAVDELTGVLRRAAGVAALERELARARRQRQPLVAAFVDVDGLKRLNDSEGHAAGDGLLRDVAEVLAGRLRGEDLVFRYGGDEFVCLLPDTALEAAQPVFEEMLGLAHARGRSFSYGLAALEDGDDAVKLLGRADQELYAGREARRAAGEAVQWRDGAGRPVTL